MEDIVLNCKDTLIIKNESKTKIAIKPNCDEAYLMKIESKEIKDSVLIELTNEFSELDIFEESRQHDNEEVNITSLINHSYRKI